MKRLLDRIKDYNKKNKKEKLALAERTYRFLEKEFPKKNKDELKCLSVLLLQNISRDLSNISDFNDDELNRANEYGDATVQEYKDSEAWFYRPNQNTSDEIESVMENFSERKIFNISQDDFLKMK